MVIEISEFNFYLFVFITLVTYIIPAYILFEYIKIKLLIADVIDNAAGHIKKSIETNFTKQINIFNSYIEKSINIADHFQNTREEQAKELEKVHLTIERKLYKISLKIEELEKKVSKDIRERDGRIYRKNKENKNLKERLKKLEGLHEN